MNEKPGHEHIVSRGVDELIERLKSEGVAAGQAKADTIVEEAKQKARQLITEAKKESEERLQKARIEAQSFQQAAESALKTAMRDMVLELKADLTREFSHDLQRLVVEATQQPELLEKMILEIVGQTSAPVSNADNVQLLLPEKIVGLEELRSDPKTLHEGALSNLVFNLTRDMLKNGVTFAASDELDGGIHIKLVDQNVTLDLSDTAVATLLLQHLQPRFRAILEGVIR
ncbi:hypothetical protein [Alteromonas facilis]|uniref:hypothetical protein n=1 Tax=Alteromonas facilis TaxID=2048004 RepID=UPI000C2905E1|nr:hypothetical protein [Alteromonas facilis]